MGSDGAFLVTHSNAVELWSWENAGVAPLRSLVLSAKKGRNIACAALSPDGRHIAVSDSHSCRVFALSPGSVRYSLQFGVFMRGSLMEIGAGDVMVGFGWMTDACSLSVCVDLRMCCSGCR